MKGGKAMDLIKEKHQELISSLEELREIVDKMNEISNDGMLIWQKTKLLIGYHT